MLTLLLLIQFKSNDNYAKTTSEFTEKKEKKQTKNKNYMNKIKIVVVRKTNRFYTIVYI